VPILSEEESAMSSSTDAAGTGTAAAAGPLRGTGLPPERPGPGRVRPAAWFGGGTRRSYDAAAALLGATEDAVAGGPQVFERVAPAAGGAGPAARWLSMLPGFPDGSYGWAQVDLALAGGPGPRLYVEYLGQGDSDAPRGFPYSTVSRADQVEAHWRAHDVRTTFVVSFDYSSLVVLELLARRLDRRAEGRPEGTRVDGVLLVNGGLFADAHSHPWRTTPFLGSRVGGLVIGRTRSAAAVRQVLRRSRMWSADHPPTAAELEDTYEVIARRDGLRYLHEGAGFVAEHRRNAGRWDLGRLVAALGPELEWHLAGSALDPFEPRQIAAARRRLDPRTVRVHDLPGGHLTTSEHPDRLAGLIRAVTR
jgi:hypothetical protein